MKAFIYEGYYSPDDLAHMLLWASGSYLKAKKALTGASNEKPARINDSAVYLAAYLIQKKEKCSDHTALKKLLHSKYRGKYRSKYRAYWDRLKKRDPEHGRTLQEVAQLVQNRHHKL